MARRHQRRLPTSQHSARSGPSVHEEPWRERFSHCFHKKQVVRGADVGAAHATSVPIACARLPLPPADRRDAIQDARGAMENCARPGSPAALLLSWDDPAYRGQQSTSVQPILRDSAHGFLRPLVRENPLKQFF
jgi:hypothetical protein